MRITAAREPSSEKAGAARRARASEQLDRARGRVGRVGRRDGQPADAPDLLAGGAQRLAAGGQDREARQARSSAEASSAQAAATCSQLSSTSSVGPAARLRARASGEASAPWRGGVTAPATSWATAGPSGAPERSTHHAAQSSRARRRSASARASRLLPAPPGPVRVSRRLAPSRPSSWSSSSSRPISGSSAVGRRPVRRPAASSPIAPPSSEHPPAPPKERRPSIAHLLDVRRASLAPR